MQHSVTERFCLRTFLLLISLYALLKKNEIYLGYRTGNILLWVLKHVKIKYISIFLHHKMMSLRNPKHHRIWLFGCPKDILLLSTGILECPSDNENVPLVDMPRNSEIKLFEVLLGHPQNNHRYL